mmetsp:Transcript_72045/g.166898  ORF Transcript_72045/g.166898 Transcript_72045/m.166898 type:complete len:219 (+) Transcript_72045:406-1062(+)
MHLAKAPPRDRGGKALHEPATKCRERVAQPVQQLPVEPQADGIPGLVENHRLELQFRLCHGLCHYPQCRGHWLRGVHDTRWGECLAGAAGCGVHLPVHLHRRVGHAFRGLGLLRAVQHLGTVRPVPCHLRLAGHSQPSDWRLLNSRAGSRAVGAHVPVGKIGAGAAVDDQVSHAVDACAGPAELPHDARLDGHHNLYLALRLRSSGPRVAAAGPSGTR